MLCTRALFFALLAQGSLAHLRTDNVQARDSGEPGEIRRTEYPPTASHLEDNKIVMDAISTDRMRNSMETLTHWNNRHYKTPSGVAASDWIFEKIKRYHGTFKISRKKHDWPQRSIDVQISEGTGQRRKDKRVIVVGAHLDSISYGDGRTADATAGAEAPGADDNASGVAVLLEALYLVLRDQRAKHFRNQVHFHFYAAEEAGLLGSKDVFQQYEKEGFDVIAVLNQDMAGRKVSEGEDIFTVVRDQFTYQPLNDFLVKVIKTYTNLGTTWGSCGRACSDHASAARSGFPASFVSHGLISNEEFKQYIHTANDTLADIDYDHMTEHVKLVLGYVFELGFWEFNAAEKPKNEIKAGETKSEVKTDEPEAQATGDATAH